MPTNRTISEIRLVTGSTGDPVLFVDYPGRDNALLFDAGENAALGLDRLGDLEAVFITHHHIDHFIGLDRIARANLDRDKALHLFGPEGTIKRVSDRVRSYEHPFFPFQKLTMEVRDVLIDRVRTARLECARRFPDPEIVESEREGMTIFANADLTVEATAADHTVPCLSYAMVEKAGYHPDPERLARGPLRPGRWVARTLELLRSGAPADSTVEIDGGVFPLGGLGERYFTVSKGSRLAFVTDTAWSDQSRPGLLKLAHRARRLYCDCFYAQDQIKHAEKYRHMTATQAAEFARAARVDELVLIHFAKRYEGHYHALIEEARAIFPKVSAVLD
jgi:ribonuclease Z